jgi:glycosyltransferase involved in cell wall biosynthesis
MRVALDVRPCLGSLTGVGRYTAELARALTALAPDVDLTLWLAARQQSLLDERLDPEVRALAPPARLQLSPISNALLYTPAAQRFWRRWPQALPVPRWAPCDVDVFHAPYWPLPLSRKTPLVLTVHDLLALRHPEWGTPALHEELRTVCALAPRAAQVITDSLATRDDLLALTRVGEARVTTVPLGVDAEFIRPQSPESVAAVRQAYALDRPYIISLATLEPRKNLGALVDAYDLACAQGLEADLVLIGGKGWGEDALAPRLAQSRKGRVRLTGYVPREDLPPLLAGALLMAFVTLGEGFGLPALEALAAGCALVASDIPVLHEVAGPCALYADPQDQENIAHALLRVAGDSDLTARLRQRGRARAAQYTWERTARETLAVYRRAAEA